MLRVAVLTSALLTLGPVSARAQSTHPNIRQGFWLGFGLGDGFAALNCGTCGSDRYGGLSGYLRLGTTWARNVLVGVEANGWLRSEAGSLYGDTSQVGQREEESISYGSFVVLWYPIRTGALYVKFGLGGMRYHADDGTDVLSAIAPCASLGIGYELRMGRAFSIVPYLNSLSSSNVVMHFNGVPNSNRDDITITLIQLGLGATWH